MSQEQFLSRGISGFLTALRRFTQIWLFSILLSAAAPQAQSVVINEVMASNGAALADEDGEFNDWIELLNPTAEPVNLQGWGLSDDPSRPFRWVFPDTTILPGEHLVVWASGKDRGGEDDGGPVEPPMEFNSTNDIPGLVVWLKADAESYSDGTAISQWTDQSGLGNHAFQNTAANRPIFRAGALNGKPAVEFSNSARRFLSLPRAAFNGMTDLRNFTYIVVARWNGGSNSGLFGAWGSSLNGNLHFEVLTGGELRLRVSDLDSARAAGVIPQNTWKLIGATMHSQGDNPVARLFVDGTEAAARHEDPGNSFLADYQDFMIGNSRDTTRCFNGQIAEVLLFNRALTTGERNAVERYLAVKFGLGASSIEGPQLHTSFSINSEGEPLLLTRPNGDLADAMPPFPMRRNLSVGRQPDGDGDWTYFAVPTPGAANTTQGYVSILRPPVFSHDRGFHSNTFHLVLSADEPAAQIYLTLDGSEPAPGNGALYAEPIEISKTAIVRAAVHKDGHLPSAAVTHSFIFIEDVLQQPPDPEGFPLTWGGSGGQPLANAHYKMDSRIVNDPAYSTMLRHAMTDLPVVSIAMNQDALFGQASGIYSNPNRSGILWERDASVEFFTPDGSEQFHLESGIRMQGGSSTEGWKVMKVSMRLFFRESYDAARLNHRIFHDSPVESFRTLILDAGHNLTWQHPDHAQRVLAQYVRDLFMPDLQRATGSLSPHGRQVHLFLNGLYWGFFNLQNRPDAAFMADNLGGNREDYDVVRHNGNNIVDGNNASWNTMMNIARAGLASPEGYAAIQEILDVPQFIDYMIVNLWAGNTDWPRHNWYAGRKREPGAKFLFFSWDAEHVLKSTTGDSRTGVSEQNTPGELYNRLRANPEFRLLFADRAQRLFFNGGPLYVDPLNPQWDPANPHRNRPASIYMKRIAEIDTAMALETARWGDTRRPEQPYSRNNEWMAELNRLLTDYFPRRSGIVLSQLQSAGIYPATGAPAFTPHGSISDSNTPVTMTAPSGGTIHYTLDGTDPRVPGSGEVSPTAIQYTSIAIVPPAKVLKARTFSNNEWSALNVAEFTVPPIAPHILQSGPYVFDHWSPDSEPGSYPPHMLLEQTGHSDPGIDAEMDGSWNLPYNLTTRSRINGLASDGISFLNTANPQESEGAGHLGAARVALDTRGVDSPRVQWTAGTVTPNVRVYALRPQYRVGTSGGFTDLAGPGHGTLDYVRNDSSGHSQTFGPVPLPEALKNQPYVELRWKYFHIDGASGARAELRLDNIIVSSGSSAATRLGFDPLPALPTQPGPLPPLTIRAVDASGITDTAFSGTVTLALEGGGALSGITSVTATNGVAHFENLSIEGGGTFRLTASSGPLAAAETGPFSIVHLTELIMPRFIQGGQNPSGDNVNRIPFASRLRIDGLNPSSTYRYANRIVTASDAPTQDGAGNVIFVTGTGSDWIRSTTSPRFQPGDIGVRHSTFTTDADGAYTGWFVTEPTGNARFTPGNTVHVRLLLNNGDGGEAIVHHLTAASPVTVLPFGEDAHAGTGIVGESMTGPRSFVLLHDDPSGDARPLAASPVEITGSEVDDRYALFYREDVAAVQSRWGALIPNNLPGGIRRIEERSGHDGRLLRVRSSLSGFGTANPSGGLTPLFLPAAEAESVFLPGGTADWTSNSNWSTPAYPNAIGASARIPAPAAESRNVELRAPVTVGALRIENAPGSDRNRVRNQGGGNRLTFHSPDGPALLSVHGSGGGFAEFEVTPGASLATDLLVAVHHITESGSEFGALRLRENWTGPGGLIKAGPGEMTLTGDGKNYTGPTIIEQGVLRVTEGGAPGFTSGVRVHPGGQLRLVSTSGESGPGTYSFGGAIHLNSQGRADGIPEAEELGVLGALRYDPGPNDNHVIVTNPIVIDGPSALHIDRVRNVMELSGNLSGSSAIKKSGGGILALSGEGGGYSGRIDVVTGTLDISGDYSGVAAVISLPSILSGSGSLGALSGSGTVSPGPGAAILTADSSAVRDYSFEFTQSGGPDFGMKTHSGNDLLRLVSSNPFPGGLQGDSRVFVYLDVAAIQAGQPYLGGFFTGLPADFMPSIQQAEWRFHLASPEGTIEHNGKTYEPLDAQWTALIDTVPQSADFGDGASAGRILRIRFEPASGSFETWRAAFFTQEELDNPAISGPNADPSGAGVPNLIRYAFGMTLMDAAADFAPAIRQVGDDFEYSFPMIAANTDIVIRIFASANLDDWSTVIFDSIAGPALPIEGGRARLILPGEEALGNAPVFLRLGVALR